MKVTDCIFAMLIVVFSVMCTVMFAVLTVPVPTDAEGCEHVRLSWQGDDMYVTIPNSELEGYDNSIIPRGLCTYAAERHITKDSMVREIAYKIKDRTADMDDISRLHKVNMFVHHNIEYANDMVTHGTVDYYQFPMETVISGKGDCEDMAILEVSILRAMGYDAILLLSQDHALVGVNIDGEGNYTELLGKRYYHLDPTTDKHPGVPDESGIVPFYPFVVDIVFVVFTLCLILCIAIFSEMICKEEE